MRIKIAIPDDEVELIREQLNIDIALGIHKMVNSLVKNLVTLAKAKKRGATTLDLKEISEKLKKVGIA